MVILIINKEVKTSPMRSAFVTVTRVVFLFVAVLLPAASFAQPSLEDAPTSITSEKYAYFVLREDRQIGSYQFRVTKQPAVGEDQEPAVRIETQMGIKVKFFFVTAYEADYSASSVYQGRDLRRHSSKAIYNGKNYLVNYSAEDNPDHLVVNASGKHLENPPMTLQPFYLEGDRDLVFVTEKGKLRNIKFRTIGTEELKIGTKFYTTTHARIEGDMVRDLWYDEDGLLIKVSYQKDGAEINLIRKGL